MSATNLNRKTQTKSGTITSSYRISTALLPQVKEAETNKEDDTDSEGGRS